MTNTADARKTPRGDEHRLDAHSFPTSRASMRGVADLAAEAMARLNRASHAGDLSEEAKACMKSPLATALATALCDDLTDIADLMVADLIDAGLSVEEVCLDHLAPAARCLGEWWEADRLPFTEVTMATSRIQAILRRMPTRRSDRRVTSENGAVFCAVPGEQHTLGVMMAADLFRRSGWDVGLLLGLEHDEIVERLVRDDRAVIGLSCSGDHSVNALERLMIALRKLRPDATILLSGRIATDAPALARLPKADTVVTDMDEAQSCMARLARARGRARAASYA